MEIGGGVRKPEVRSQTETDGIDLKIYSHACHWILTAWGTLLIGSSRSQNEVSI